MKRNIALELLSIPILAFAQLSVAGPGPASIPELFAQRSDTIWDTTNRLVPPVLEKSRTDTQPDKTVNERERQRHDRNNDWKSKKDNSDRKNDRNRDDQRRNDRKTDEPTQTNDIIDSHGR